jgi:hypothetical protein
VTHSSAPEFGVAASYTGRRRGPEIIKIMTTVSVRCDQRINAWDRAHVTLSVRTKQRHYLALPVLHDQLLVCLFAHNQFLTSTLHALHRISDSHSGDYKKYYHLECDAV